MIFNIIIYLLNIKKQSNIMALNKNKLKLDNNIYGSDNRNSIEISNYLLEKNFNNYKLLKILEDKNINIITKLSLIDIAKPNYTLNLHSSNLMKDWNFTNII
jgi:hypothetical protein